ncbi:MAG: EthD domain-containing protein [Novosphingobium sp.]|nr:EthD domain-containing protein [Novosphingobium sp.]
MIINLGFYKRRSDLTHEEFSKHWTEVHGPLIRSIPGIEQYLTHYVQHHVVPDPANPLPFDLDYDGFSEAHFPSIEARDALFNLPFFQTRVIEDEHKFIDMERTRIIVIDEPRTIIRGFVQTPEVWAGLPGADTA